MTDKELRKLSRAELLEMLITVSKENEMLRTQIEKQDTLLKEREISLSRAGSIAEAALELNGVFTAAEAAAAQYLENVRGQEDICQRMEEGAKEEAEKIVAEAQQRAGVIEARAKQSAVMMETQAKQRADAYWAAVSRRLEEFYEEHKGLQEMLRLDRNNE